MAQTTGIRQLDDLLTLAERDFGIRLSDSRVSGWKKEIRSGSGRSMDELRRDFLRYVLGPDRVAKWVRSQFRDRGLLVGATPNETANQRVRRITNELLTSQRTFFDLKTTLDRYASPGGTSGGGRTGGGGGSGGSSGGGGGSRPPAPTREQRNAVATLRDAIARYGLPPSLADWAWDQVVVQGLSEPEVVLELRDRPEFKERFPAIAQGATISPGEYVSYEQRALEIMQASGVAGVLFDTAEEFQEFVADQIINHVSLNELAQRTNDNLADVMQAPPEVRNAFAEYFGSGTAGDKALGALMLDPDLALPKLERMVAAAEVGGAAARFDFGLSETFATRAAELGITGAQAAQRLGQAARLRPLTENLWGERRTFSEGDLVQSQLFDDPTATDRLRRRAETRIGMFGGGSATVDQQGVSGLGTADDGF